MCYSILLRMVVASLVFRCVYAIRSTSGSGERTSVGPNSTLPGYLKVHSRTPGEVAARYIAPKIKCTWGRARCRKGARDGCSGLH